MPALGEKRGPYKKKPPSLRIECAECKTTFLAHRPTRMYCSSECMWKAAWRAHPVSKAKPKAMRNCLVCQTEFLAAHAEHQHCSKACAAKNYVAANREKLNARTRVWMKKDREARPERSKAIGAAYRARPKNKQHAAQKSREWHEENREYANPQRMKRLLKRLETHPWHVALLGARKRAELAKMPHDLTDDWAAARWTGRCELTNIPFVRGTPRFKLMTASCDKIVPSLGYVQSNCRFILFCVNVFKNNGDDDLMYLVAEALLSHRKHL